MTDSRFDPRASVEGMGARAKRAVEAVAGGATWTPATLRAASLTLEQERAPRLAKRMHLLAAIWAVNHPEVHL